MENLKYVLEMENISKEFPGVKALDDVHPRRRRPVLRRRPAAHYAHRPLRRPAVLRRRDGRHGRHDRDGPAL